MSARAAIPWQPRNRSISEGPNEQTSATRAGSWRHEVEHNEPRPRCKGSYERSTSIVHCNPCMEISVLASFGCEWEVWYLSARDCQANLRKSRGWTGMALS